MKHIRKKISKITEELMNYFFSIGATDITANIKEENDGYMISVKSNYIDEQDEKLKKLIKCLKCEKHEEIEEYYWELAGECDIDSELSLIGMMIDKAEITFIDDIIEIVLYKYK